MTTTATVVDSFTVATKRLQRIEARIRATRDLAERKALRKEMWGLRAAMYAAFSAETKRGLL